MADTQVKLRQLKQDGATSGQAIVWSGSTWQPQGVGTVTSVGITPPSQGITVSGSPVTSSGNITLSLADDLAALENLSTTGIAVRTGTSTWTTRSIGVSEGSPNHGLVSMGSANNNGVSGNPTVSVIPSDHVTWKRSVRCATTGNITLSGFQTIDGISVGNGDRVLVKDQTTASQNGIYEVLSSTWIRASDASSGARLDGSAIIYVRQGTTNGGKFFRLTTTAPITIGTTALNFVEASFGNGIYSGSGTIPNNTNATLEASGTFRIRYSDAANAILVSEASGKAVEIAASQGRVIVDDTKARVQNNAGTFYYEATSSDAKLQGYTNITNHGATFTTVNISSDQNNFNPSEFTAGSYVRMNVTANCSITGIQAPTVFGKILYLHNVGTHRLSLLDDSTSSSAANRFALTGNIVLGPKEGIMLYYDDTLSRWRGLNLRLGGIYSGSGTIPASTAATVSSSSTFEFRWSNDNPAFRIEDSVPRVYMKDRTGSAEVVIDNGTINIQNSDATQKLNISTTNGSSFTGKVKLSSTAFKKLDLSISTTQHNYNPTGLSGHSFLNIDPTAASLQITGIQAQDEGTVLIIRNTGVDDLVIANENTSSSASNRFNIGSNFTLAPNESIAFYYVNNRWRFLITPSAGSGDGNGIYSGNGTVSGTTVATLASGATLKFAFGTSDALVLNRSDDRVAITTGSGSDTAAFVAESDSASVSATGANSSVQLQVTNGSNYTLINLTPTIITLSGAATLPNSNFSLTSANISADTNDLTTSALGRASFIQVNPSGNFKVTGLSGSQSTGRLMWVQNTSSSNNLTLSAEDSGSSANNRFGFDQDVLLEPSEVFGMFYATNRWRPFSQPNRFIRNPASGKFSGITTKFVAQQAQNIGDLVRINASGNATIAQANNFDNATVVAMATSSITASSTGTYLLRGFITNSSWSWTVGAPIYLSTTGTTNNTLTQTRPNASGNIVVPIGYAVSATTIYFNPSMTLVEVA